MYADQQKDKGVLPKIDAGLSIQGQAIPAAFNKGNLIKSLELDFI